MSSRVRVLVVNDTYGCSSAAGAALHAAEAATGAEMELFFLAAVDRPEEAARFERGGIEVEQVHVPPYTMRWRAYRTPSYGPGVRAFASAAARIAPDLVHFNNVHTRFSYAALDAARAAGAKVVLTVHDVMPFCPHKMFCFLHSGLEPGAGISYRARFFRCMRCERFRFNPFRNRAVRRILERSCDCVVAVSTPMARALRENGLPVHQVVYNGVDCDALRPPEDGGAAARSAFGLEGSRVILHAGRLDRLKGGLHLLRAAARVRDRVPNLKLLLPGQGNLDAGELAAAARDLNLEDALVLPGWIEGGRLRAAYGAAHVVASPSLCFESFNLVNLEGMAAGKPVVTSFFGGPAEVVQHEVTGYLVNPLHVEDLAEKLVRLLSDEALAERMGRAGRLRAERCFHIALTGEKYRNLYETLAKSGIPSFHEDMDSTGAAPSGR